MPPGVLEKITSAEVAKRAGVSQSAVSRVFTPGASASPEMTERVRLAAQELGYRPNVLARSLITGRSRIIGLVISYLENNFYPEVLEKLSGALQQRGYHVLVFMAPQNADNIDDVVQEILDYQVDGIVTASVAMSSDLATRCQSAGIPVVLFNRGQDDPRLSAVESDNRAGGAALGRLLIAGGHKRIGYIAGWEGASTQRDREAGFVEALKQAGIALHSRAVGNFRHDEAAAAAREMFTATERPDAVFVANDHMAFAAMDVLRFELDLRIPEDVSVVGYDDVPMAAWPSYNLTTVRQSAEAMVDRTVDILIQHIEQNDSTPRREIVAAPLIQRGSARVPVYQGSGNHDE